MKLSQYNAVLEMDYGLLVYNTNTTEVMKIKKEDLVDKFKALLETKIFDINDPLVKLLYDKKFLVDDEVDEFLEAKQLQYERLKKEDNDAQILIHTTDNCNFRCVYCFKEAKPQDLSDENWENLYLYLKKSFAEKKFEEICLAFYGGEPMLKYHKIIEFMEKVNILKAGYPDIKVIYRMTTNGYLLTPEKYDRLAELGIEQFQITIDGFAETHNKMRPLANGAGSWSKIIENLEYINTIDDEVCIMIRTNYNSINKQEIDELNEWLKEKFKNEKFLYIKVPVTKYSDDVDDELVMDRRDNFVQEQEDKSGILNYEALMHHGMICEYTKKNRFALSAKGEISHCEEIDTPETIVGVLSEGGVIDYRVDYEQWCSRLETEECKTCIVYPLCLARSCAKMRKCSFMHDDFRVLLNKIMDGKVF